MTRSTLALVTGVLLGTSALFRPAPSKICRSRTAAGLSCCAAEAAPELLAPPEAQVLPAGCPSCEDEWLKRSKETEASEKERLASLRADDMNTYLSDIWDYAQRMNDTQRQELALTPDTMLRSFIIDSSTPPTKLLEHVYNATMGRVPYEQACYICGPEQALLLRTLVALAHPRRCLDVGSFTGYSSAAVLEALPADAEMTCIEIEPTYTALLDELLGDRATVLTGPALAHLQQFAAEGRTFDFITLDADKPLHGEYVNASIALLRPGGLIVMFGMLLFPTAEDQVNTQRPPPLPLLSLPPSTSFLVSPSRLRSCPPARPSQRRDASAACRLPPAQEAMEKLHEQLPNRTDIATAQMPVGCGIQLMVKLEGTGADAPTRAWTADDVLEGEAAERERRRWRLQSELAAIDRVLEAQGTALGGAGVSGPGTEALTSSGLIALGAQRRNAEEAGYPAM